MQPQDVAVLGSCESFIEALPSQTRSLNLAGYVFPKGCSMLTPRNTQVSLTSKTERAGPSWPARSNNTDRRPRCPRASNSWQRSALLPQSRPVLLASLTKSSSWSTPSPSRLSLHTQASTNKNLGQAFAPVPTQPRGTQANVGGA
jgi:hypothetical protein